MSFNVQKFLSQCLLFDIEVNEKGQVYALGAALGDKRFYSEKERQVTAKTLSEFDAFGRDAKYILGHNILQHDIPILQELYPNLALLKKPAIDTLYLSPLAYPANPYHRLVKDYQLVRDSVNNPTGDALLAGKVFLEQCTAFESQLQSRNEALLYYRAFLEQDRQLKATADILGYIGVPLIQGDALHTNFSRFCGKHCCSTAVKSIINDLANGRISPMPLAYVTAWLTVAGGNSVLPPWVRHQFPQISALLYKLREVPCADSNCQYCTKHHNPKTFLQDYFGFDDFRPEPQTEDGDSLQGRIITVASQNKTLFATLPTGGGKSLCYLLPALMRYQRRNLLTIVISPLQALMKDQVDNFSHQTGTKIATALYGMLTMPERGEVLESIRSGSAGILYVSPEQLRNNSFINVISQREIGAWIFDEAHCLSKWGHDFRPDYFYAIRFIREFATKEKTAIPAVQCFTATAKKDVKAEIIDTIQSGLALKVYEFAGGHERTNLHYDVYAVDKYEKNQAILEILSARYDGVGAVVIYCATKKKTEKLTDLLVTRGYNAETFHAGLDASVKKRILESFIAGEIPIICATNAFGMGIDKDDVRLVLHADIPGSLENYLQEAGRAGRDRQNAECILVFDEQDIEGQFRLSSSSRLSQREIAQMLRGIRYAARGGDKVVLTPGELLKQEVVDLDDDLYDPETRVRTAVAWLEKAGLLQRNENNTRVFQGKPQVKDLQEAKEKIAKLDLSKRQQKRWLAILEAFMQQQGSAGFTTDELASLSSFSTCEEDVAYQTDTQRVLTTLHDMAEQGLLSKETILSAYIRYKTSDNAELKLKRICDLEHAFLKSLEQLTPDVELDVPLELDLRLVNQHMLDQGLNYSTQEILNSILNGLGQDGKGLAGNKGSLKLIAKGNYKFTVALNRDWQSLNTTMEIRQLAANTALNTILSTIPPNTKRSKDLKVEFTLEQITESFKTDLNLFSRIQKPLAVAERALTFMHELKIIDLQQGLAIFRQAMTLYLDPEEKRKYNASDFEPLNSHYDERNFQIHVMNEYARQALKKISTAMRLVGSYFNDEKEDFIKKYFPSKKGTLNRPTTEQSYQRIVKDLHNKAQEAIVTAHHEKNMLVLAGPGSGKTRAVIHRIAFLLRVKRISAGSILVLCFNRSAVMQLRSRLRDLVGEDMKYVTALTFHGLALRLTGRSLVTSDKKEREDIDFSRIIKDAILLLKGETDVLGHDDMSIRDDLIGRFSHILVDEYQDIDAEQYELISLLAGRGEEDHNQKMTIMAVGDDDQNIYRFRGANIGFIRKFHEDYQAETHYLVQNYRSTANIISACNMLIVKNQDRMKTEHPIRINDAKKMLPHGGNWQIHDRVNRGKVLIQKISTISHQAQALLEEIQRLQGLEGNFDQNSCAILARGWEELDSIRSLFEEHNIPINLSWGRETGFPSLTRIRENVAVLEYLKGKRTETIKGSELLSFLSEKSENDNIWQANIRVLLNDWIEDTHDTEQPVSQLEGYLYESLADQRKSKNLGNGIFLSTVHSVKGLEFDHVFMLGGGWQKKNGNEEEEERRLFYVGMSRARETLCLFDVEGIHHPYLENLEGDAIATSPAHSAPNLTAPSYKYSLLGMDNLFIDFAGMKSAKNSTHKSLTELTPDTEVHLAVRNNKVEIIDSHGISVARLSRKAQEQWFPRMNQINFIKVIGLVTRKREDSSDENFKARVHSECWEIPLVELKYSHQVPNEKKSIALQSKKKKMKKSDRQERNLKSGKPKNAGLPWKDVSKQALSDHFKQGKTIEQLSYIFGRTQLSIASELNRQGLISEIWGEKLIDQI